MVADLKPQGKTARVIPGCQSPRQTEYDEQCTVELVGCSGIDLANDAPNPITPQRDHLVRHDLRAKAKSVRRSSFNNRSERQLFLNV